MGGFRRSAYLFLMQLLLDTKLIAFEYETDSSSGVLRVKGKGNKTREVPVLLIDELRQYYKHYRPKTYLFEGTKPGFAYSATSFYNIVKFCCTFT